LPRFPVCMGPNSFWTVRKRPLRLLLSRRSLHDVPPSPLLLSCNPTVLPRPPRNHRMSRINWSPIHSPPRLFPPTLCTHQALFPKSEGAGALGQMIFLAWQSSRTTPLICRSQRTQGVFDSNKKTVSPPHLDLPLCLL